MMNLMKLILLYNKINNINRKYRKGGERNV